MERGTFRSTQHGDRYVAYDYICEHGVSMLTCLALSNAWEREVHQQTGRAMVKWFNEQPTQITQRLNTRDRISNVPSY